MRLATYLSLATLVAPAALAIPFGRSSFLARRDNEVRDFNEPALVERQETVLAQEGSSTEEETSTEDPTATSSFDESETATTTDDASEETSTDEPFYYSTISDDDNPRRSPRTYTDGDESGGIERQTRDRSSEYGQDGSATVVIVVAEIERVTRVIRIETPILVAVEVNVEFRRNDFGKRYRNRLRRKFNNWRDEDIDQLLIIIVQQYDIISRYGNNRFRDTDNNRFDRFVEKFLNQLDSFDSFDGGDIQALIVVVQGFDSRDLRNFFGKSDSLYRRYRERGNGRNDYRGFVDAIEDVLDELDDDDFDVDDIFDLVEQLADDLNVDQFNLFIGSDGRGRGRDRHD